MIFISHSITKLNVVGYCYFLRSRTYQVVSVPRLFESMRSFDVKRTTRELLKSNVKSSKRKKIRISINDISVYIYRSSATAKFLLD